MLTCKSFSQYTNSLEEAVTTLAEDESIQSMSTDEQNMKFGETIMSSLNELSAVETSPIELSLRARRQFLEHYPRSRAGDYERTVQ